MTGRKCGSCKHYEPAPIWRKGWCRNPLLYSPQQSHLVGEEDLDCERGMGNYWETNQFSGPMPYIPLHPVPISSSPPPAVSNDTGYRHAMTTPGGQTIFPVSGSSGYPGDPVDDDVPPPPDRRAADPRGRERQLDYYTEERYWTDYVRIGLPIIGVVLILLVALLWIIPFFSDDDDGDNTAGAGGTATTTIPVIAASPTTTDQAGATRSPQIILTTPAGTTTPGTPNEPTQTTAEPPATGGEIYNGAIVAVANTGGAGVNMRSTASVDGEVVTVALDGTEFTVVGEAEEADGFIWWPVEGESGTGYIVEDYLTLIQ